MAQKKNVNAFTGSMNMDVNPTFLRDGDYVMARNVRIGFSEEDNMGCVENYRGTLEIPNPFLSDRTGRWRVVGAATYEAMSLVYQFRKDSLGEIDFIEEFNLLTRSFSIVLSGKLGLADKIPTARYFNDMLFWNDGITDPKQISVSLGKLGYAYSQPYTTTLIKFPPDRAITCEPHMGSPMVHGPLGPNQYQFIYRYVFANNQKSVWSVPSRMCAIPSDEYDYIRLHLNATHIQLASQYKGFIKYVEVGFRDDTTQPWYYLKRVDFPSINPSAANPFYIDFYNDVQYSPIATDETDMPFSDVPVSASDFTMIENRVLMGGNTYGYGPATISLNATVDVRPAVTDLGNYMLGGGRYYIGVVFYDAYDRRSFVYPVSVYTQPNRNGPFVPQYPKITLSGIVPDGYVSWRPVVSNCFNIGNFVQAHIEVVNANAIELRFKVGFVSPSPDYVSWAFTTGDRLSILTQDSTGNPFPRNAWDQPFDFDTADGNYVVKGDFTGMSTGALVQLYTPIKGTSTPFYYEVGDTYVVMNNSFGSGPVTIDLDWGDTVWSLDQKAQIRNMDPNKYDTWFRNNGRGNIASQDVQQKTFNGSEICFGDPFIQGTNVNGLNSFSSANKKSYGIELGNITKLTTARDYQINGSVMLVTTQYNNYSIYIGKVQLSDTSQSNNLVITDQLLGTANLLAGGYGTINPESVHAFGTTVRGWDALKGVMWRYSQDGLTPISMEYGANSYSRKLAETIAPNRGNVAQRAVSCYDPFFDEWLICIRDVKSDSNSTIGFQETKNGYSNFHDFDPDWMVTINSLVVSWKHGILYLHRQNEEYNTLQGQRVTSSVSFVSKLSEYDTMNGISLRVYSQDNWTPKVTGIKRTRGITQSTTVGASYANEREDYFDYPITDSATGDPMKSRHFIVELTLDPAVDKLSVLYGAHLTDSVSPDSLTKT